MKHAVLCYESCKHKRIKKENEVFKLKEEEREREKERKKKKKEEEKTRFVYIF